MALNNQVITQPLVDAVSSILEANRPAINEVLNRYYKPGGGRLSLGPIFTGRRASRKLQTFPNLAMTVTSRSMEWFHSRHTKDTITLRILCNVLVADDDTHEKVMNDLTDVVESVLYQNPIFSFNVIDGDNNQEGIVTVSTSGVVSDSRGTIDDGFLKTGQIDWAAEMLISWRDMNFITNVPGEPASTSLSFVTHPLYASAGTSFLQQPVVHVLDQFGLLTPEYTGRLEISITPDTGATGAVLSGNTIVSIANGVGVFHDLTIDKPASDYTLNVVNKDFTSDFSLTGISSVFVVSPVATKLVFTTSPANSSTTLTAPSPIVEIRDAFDNLVTSYAGAVSLTYASTSPNIAPMHGSTTVTPVNGVATFDDILIDAVGTYNLKAVSGLLEPCESSAFAVLV